MTVNFHEQFEELSRLKVKSEDSLDDVLYRLGEKLCLCLKVERVNVWLFHKNPNRIECIANYESINQSFSKGEVLNEAEIQTYFSHLASDRAIKIQDVQIDPITFELKDNYCKKHHVRAILDIPVRIGGKLAGVICFEDTKTPRVWNDEEVNFALAVSQIVSLSIENFKRKKYEKRLKKALDEKNTLLVEMHHRLKNNLTMLVSLMRIQSNQITDPKSQEAFENIENQILSISKLHEQLYVSENFVNVNLNSYLQELVQGLQRSYSNSIEVHAVLEDVIVKSEKAVPIGLIVNEIISNSIKHATVIQRKLIIQMSLKLQGENFQIELSDDGKGFNLTDELRSSFGLGLIYDLSEQLNGKILFTSNDKGTRYQITFQK